MNISNNTINIICRDYVTLDYNGVIDFKLSLKENIRNNSISKEDALFILLDLLYQANHGLKYRFVSQKVFDLVNNVKKYNKENKDYLKEKILFNKAYFPEIKIIIDYILVLAEEININDRNIKIEKPKTNIKYSKKLIKNKLNSFSRNDLCYILDLDSNLNFEREKVLKNRIINELSNNSFDLEELNNCSKEDIKNILNSKNNIVNFSNDEIIKIQNVHLYDLKDEFEKKYENQLKKENESQRKKLEKERKKRKERENRRKLQKKLKKERENQPRIINEKIKIRNERLRKEKKEKERKINFLRRKIELFNNKNFSEMILFEKEYSNIYDEVLNNNSELSQYEEIILFKNYFSHLNQIKRIIIIENEIKSNINSLDQFDYDLKNKGFLNYSKRKKIINKYRLIYDSASKLNEYSNFLKDKIFQEFNNLKSFMEYYEDLTHYKNMSDDGSNKIIKLNEKILDEEINKNADFFKDITDKNKKRAILIDEKNVKVNAGAGTGKTFTIQKKVNYLIEKKGISPKKILCLSYTVDGAIDLNKKLNSNRADDDKVYACTFHKFCRRVAEKCGKSKERTYRELLENVVLNYSKEFADDKKLSKIIDYFTYYINSPADNEDIDNYDELLIYEKGKDLKTLKKKFYESGVTVQTMQGEIVDSIGELIIANYLFMHEIDYVYGKGYESNLIKLIQNRFLYSGKSISSINLELQKDWLNKFISKYSWSSYIPDFYLPEKDIYLEHFGIGHTDNEKWLGKDYEPQIKRKEKYHELHQTKLLKTYYCYLEDGVLLEKLEKILRDNNVKIGQKNREEILDVLKATNKVKDFDNFNKLIMNFINIFEAQNREKNQFDIFKKMNEMETDGYKRNRQKLFLDIVSDIYDIYYELNEGKRIDNNREVSLALELIQNKEYSASFDYIFIDEYQDINPIRSLLLQSLQKITNAKLFVVGDDWQSIYKFNGSDLNLFLNFDKYFPNSEYIKLQENRRNYDKINKIASDFIIKNDVQDKKELDSIKKSKFNSDHIKIVNYSIRDKRDKVLKLESIIRKIINRNQNSKILILGRNNDDIYEFTNNNIFKLVIYNNDKKVVKYLENPTIDITFMTIHKSKGLEYDYVIILNFKDELNGFPNKIEDDSIIYFLKEKEKYQYGEERRLLYVALTRTLNDVYLFSPVKNKSVFIEELINEHDVKQITVPINKKLKKNFYISKSNEPFDYRKTDIDCPYCDDGKITVVRNNKTGKKYVRCSNHIGPDASHYSGGPYWGDIEDYVFIEKCPNPKCDGVLIKGYKKDKLTCTFNREGCKETKDT